MSNGYNIRSVFRKLYSLPQYNITSGDQSRGCAGLVLPGGGQHPLGLVVSAQPENKNARHLYLGLKFIQAKNGQCSGGAESSYFEEFGGHCLSHFTSHYERLKTFSRMMKIYSLQISISSSRGETSGVKSYFTCES